MQICCLFRRLTKTIWGALVSFWSNYSSNLHFCIEFDVFLGDMNNPTLHEISIRELRKHFPSAASDDLSEDFFISEVYYKEGLDTLKEPCRVNGYMAIFCLEGELTAEINLNRYEISANTVVINVPGNISRIHKLGSATSRLHFMVIAASDEFISGSRVDFARLFDESIAILSNPCFRINEEQRAVFRSYFELVQTLVAQKLPGIEQAALRDLVSSALYYAGAVWKNQIESAPRHQVEAAPSSTRAKLVFESFLKLVAKYHSRERGMAFYAEKLCLTPKYLSKLIKTVSGQSGPEWIDSFVIVEAKNMLKYSDMPIKEIVYRLNFPNSSVFYKFFKSHTGQTPSEYRK